MINGLLEVDDDKRRFYPDAIVELCPHTAEVVGLIPLFELVVFDQEVLRRWPLAPSVDAIGTGLLY